GARLALGLVIIVQPGLPRSDRAVEWIWSVGGAQRFADIGERPDDQPQFVDPGRGLTVCRQRDTTLRGVIDVGNRRLDMTARQAQPPRRRGGTRRRGPALYGVAAR